MKVYLAHPISTTGEYVDSKRVANNIRDIGIIVDNIDDVGYKAGEVQYPLAEIKKGDRIAQLVVQQLPTVVAYELTGVIGETERGARGFGSTGE